MRKPNFWLLRVLDGKKIKLLFLMGGCDSLLAQSCTEVPLGITLNHTPCVWLFLVMRFSFDFTVLSLSAFQFLIVRSSVLSFVSPWF